MSLVAEPTKRIKEVKQAQLATNKRFKVGVTHASATLEAHPTYVRSSTKRQAGKELGREQLDEQ